MSNHVEPPVGAWFVTRSQGRFARTIRVVTDSPVNHAGIYLGNGQFIEALAAGASIGHLPLDAPYAWSHHGYPLTVEEGERVAHAARLLEGTPYSWTDVAGVGLLHTFGWNVPEHVRRGIQHRVTGVTTRRLFCSQLVDEAHRLAGVHLYQDGRSSGNVTPGDIWELAGRPGLTNP